MLFNIILFGAFGLLFMWFVGLSLLESMVEKTHKELSDTPLDQDIELFKCKFTIYLKAK